MFVDLSRETLTKKNSFVGRKKNWQPDFLNMFVEPRDADKSVAADVASAQLVVALVLLVLAVRGIGVEHLHKSE
jgi:hypothetical protein